MVVRVDRRAKTRLVTAAGVAALVGVVAASTLADAATHQPRVNRRPEAAVVAGFGGHRVVEEWSRTLPDAGDPIALSSPTSALVDGRRAVVVGDLAGNLWALDLADGANVPGWPYHAGAPIESPPSAAAGQIFFGVGSAAVPGVTGGYRSVWAAGRGNGRLHWERSVSLTPDGGRLTGVAAGLSVGVLQGHLSVVAGSLGQMEGAYDVANGASLRGFPWWQADTQFDTPAVADLFGNGQDEIIEGGASTANPFLHPPYYNGGHLRVLSATGRLLCVHNTNEEVDSSPAVGRFLAGGAVGIVDGTGTFYEGVSDEDALIAMTPGCRVTWEDHLAGATSDSPALVGALPGPGLEVAMGTAAPGGGYAYLIDGADGRPIWRTHLAGSVIGGITSADLGGTLDGRSYQDLLVPTTAGLYILDGRSGSVLAHLPGIGLQSSPLVTGDPDGLIGITIAGYDGHNQGQVVHLEVTGTHALLADAPGAWPMFHRDPQLTGTTLAPLG
jgi:hypothetical protein